MSDKRNGARGDYRSKSDEQSRAGQVMHLILRLADMCGYDIVNRVVLIDKKTGKVYR